MVRIFILLISMNLSWVLFAQNEEATIHVQNIPEMRVDRNFRNKYNRALNLLIRTYPMALKAKELIDEYESDLAELDKKRQKKKYGRHAHKDLKEEFTYNIRDLYRSEGDMLMKVIHRETGMTVHDIIEKYRGDVSSDVYSGLAKAWGHDLNTEYDPKDPNSDDWVTEIVIQDILNGRINFDTEMRKMNKAEYKESMEEYREKRRDTQERIKQIKKDNRMKERSEKRSKKKKD